MNQNQNKIGLDAGTSEPDSFCSDETSAKGYTARVLQKTTSSPCSVGGVANMLGQNVELVTTSIGVLCSPRVCFTPAVPLSVPVGVELDGGQQIWIANSGKGSVSTLAFNYDASTAEADFTATSPVAYLHGTDNGSTMSAPFGLAIDNSGNVWVSNANCTSQYGVCPNHGFTLSELIGAAYPTLTRLRCRRSNTEKERFPRSKRFAASWSDVVES